MNDEQRKIVDKFLQDIKQANIESDNLHCILALIAVDYIQKYLVVEEEGCSDIEWIDKKGYSFATDIGYFFEGLEGIEQCLIKRLRGCTNERNEK